MAFSNMSISISMAHSVLAGGIAGGGTYAVLRWIRPKMGRSLRLGIAGMVGVVAAGLIYSATGEPKPFGRTWVQDIPRSHYGRGAPLRDRQELTAQVGCQNASTRLHQTTEPDSVISFRALRLRSATLTISEERDGLKIEDDAVSANGQQQHLSYTFVADGVERPAPTATTDTVAVTIKDDTLSAVLRKARLVTERETATLSAARKQMNLTTETALPDGNTDEVIAQFYRKE
jgi:hypothetical protein